MLRQLAYAVKKRGGEVSHLLACFFSGMKLSHEGVSFRLAKGGQVIIAKQALFHDVRRNFDGFFELREDKTTNVFDLRPARVCLSKGDQKIIFETNYEGEKRAAVENFDALFELCEPEGNVLDFTAGVNFFGYKIKTTPSTILEIDLAFKPYGLHYSLKEGDIVLDCGAYHGAYALYASRQVGCGKIFAFEPDEENYRILEDNVSLNKIKNIVPVNKGIWSSSGKMPFQAKGSVESTLLDFSAANDEGNAATVEVVSIPEFFTENKLEKIDFVKMDIEGAEVNAVEGCLDFLKTRDVNFAIASYHLKDGAPTSVKLEELFKRAGYLAVTENPRHQTTYAAPASKAEKSFSEPTGN